MAQSLLVSIYKSGDGDATNHGVTEHALRAVLFLEKPTPEEVEKATEQTQQQIRLQGTAVLVVERVNILGTVYVRCRPYTFPDEARPYFLMGGNFVYSSDSRFRELVNPYPIGVHDRTEG
jgi:hypothetical protein